MATALPKQSVSSLISIAVQLTIAAAQSQNLSTLLLLDNSLEGGQYVIDTNENYRIYNTAAAVLADFPTTDPGVAAQVYFASQPKPKQIIVGRWPRAAFPSKLVGATGASSVKTIAQWQAVTAGAFAITVNGTVTQITGMNFSAVLDYNGVATITSTALGANGTCRYNAALDRFEFSGVTTGTGGTLSFLAAPSSGTNVSAFYAASSAAAPAAYVVGGGALVSATNIIAFFDQLIGRKWYALGSTFAQNTEIQAFANYCMAANNKHIIAFTDNDVNELSNPGVDTTSLGYLLNQQKCNRSFIQYVSSNANGAEFACLSSIAKLLTIDRSGSETNLTLMYKQDQNITPENLTDSQAAALKAKGVNVFVNYDNDTALLQYGTMSDGTFADEIASADWFATTVQTALYNRLYTTTTRIPQTDAGMHELLTVSEGICSLAVKNGIAAPGVWQADGFGELNYGDFLPKGFYVYQGKVADQLISDRAARKATSQQIAIKLAGAVHTIDVSVLINP